MRLALVALLLAACRGGEATPPPRPYAVRGEIARAPAQGPHGLDVLVRHEAIDDFADQSGKVVGMDAMVMPFRIEHPEQARGLAAGDKVLIRFAMDWERAVLRVDRIDRLPADTALDFRQARPPGAAR